MASIFTFDPDPPRVSSPWLTANNPENEPPPNDGAHTRQTPTAGEAVPLSSSAHIAPTTRLQAEPQEGPTEYKLHLLLRPRRSVSAVNVAGSQHSKSASSTPRSVSEASLAASPPIAASNSTRQHRLEQLTTQLLWRLQQSSPYHSTSPKNLILPSLPEAKPELQAPERPAKLLPGLEESRGALYEIGVSDDGTLVGLTMDEMNESLNNLRAMAASLGCTTEILRMVCVGDCEWPEPLHDDNAAQPQIQTARLYVAEAYVKPELRSSQDVQRDTLEQRPLDKTSASTSDPYQPQTGLVSVPERPGEQLRVSLIGATTCGKSSLLGTLSTSTLDNSRGKSRLSLLKHRHEIASGVTSSVAQELVGYQDEDADGVACASVINYATENVSSWTDIHAASESGRLALLSDSAGHPRYRRTTVRGLVGWAPHWIFLCIAANEDPSMSAHGPLATSDDGDSTFVGANAHISIAHLDLCLKLEVPLVVVVTKFDTATKSGFRSVLSTLLTRLKDAGKKPEIVSNDNHTVTENDLQRIPAQDISEISRIAAALAERPLEIVPIIFTSAVKGTGIAKLHALLRHLPLTPPSLDTYHETHDEGDNNNSQQTPHTVFHVDDLFNLQVGKSPSGGESLAAFGSSAGSVLSGHLASGTISIGDELRLGPFSDMANTNSSEDASAEGSSNELADGFLTPRSFTDALVKVTSSPKLGSMPAAREWRRVKVISVRNLRMPVHSLRSDQVGTIGILPVDTAEQGATRAWPLQIRKGMVLASGGPTSAHTFTANFHVDEASSIIVGTMVVVYCASVRTSAKVVAVALNSSQPSRRPSRSPSPHLSPAGQGSDDYAFGFEFDDDQDQDQAGSSRDRGDERSHKRDTAAAVESILVTFRLVTTREWLETGAKVLVMPGGGPGLHGGTERGVKGIGGLEGFVGRIVETFG